ncbi:histidine kinase [Nonomuraea sp. NPDC050310]|uniref:sensor histidine kinase n=1 Tax=Nonomuraea sp. NPDC050310 TaxID=3154935 RepID=UPI0033CD8F7A
MTPRHQPVQAPYWLMPGELVPGRRRRTPRDWASDAALFAFAVAMWFDGVIGYPPAGVDFVPEWMIAINPWVGALACLAVWARRRYPVAVALLLLPALFLSGAALGAAMVAVFTLAVHQPWTRAVAVAALHLLGVSYYALFADPPGMSRITIILWTALLFVGPLCAGFIVRSRRLVLIDLRREAEVREREHRARLADTRRAERTRLAREMHDVLAHRISLLSVHAGALAYRTARAGAGQAPALEPTEVDAAVRVIHDNARLALDELGQVLSILRDDTPTLPPHPTLPTLPPTAPPAHRHLTATPTSPHPAEAPAPRPLTGPPVYPRLADLPALVADASAAGQPVTLDCPTTLDGLRPQLERAIYRVVQEGLTNARKHAPGAPVHVTITPGPALTVHITNPSPHPAAANGGYGLVGLTERVTLEGGTLTHGHTNGTFHLTAHLPTHTP